MWKLIVDLHIDSKIFDFDEREHALAFMLDVLEHGLRRDGEDGALTLYPPAAIRMFEIWEEHDGAAADLDLEA